MSQAGSNKVEDSSNDNLQDQNLHAAIINQRKTASQDGQSDKDQSETSTMRHSVASSTADGFRKYQLVWLWPLIFLSYIL